jgi:hypothetical protein
MQLEESYSWPINGHLVHTCKAEAEGAAGPVRRGRSLPDTTTTVQHPTMSHYSTIAPLFSRVANRFSLYQIMCLGGFCYATPRR